MSEACDPLSSAGNTAGVDDPLRETIHTLVMRCSNQVPLTLHVGSLEDLRCCVLLMPGGQLAWGLGQTGRGFLCVHHASPEQTSTLFPETE